MPVTPTYPGVYIEEIPSGVRTITGVATAITAFVGRARRGPVNEPVTVNSFSDFERSFGGLWADSPMSYAVRDFFLNGGGQAVIVRLYHTRATNDDGSAGYTDGALKLKAASQGEWGNKLSLKIDTDGITDEVVQRFQLPTDVTEEDFFNLTVIEGPPNGPREVFRNVSLHSHAGSRRLDNVLASSSSLVQVDGTLPDTAMKPNNTSDASDPTLRDNFDPKTGEPKHDATIRFFQGGANSDPLTQQDYQASLDSNGKTIPKTGISALDKTDLFNLLVIPPDRRADQEDPDYRKARNAVYNDALTYCVNRRAFLIIDPPAAWGKNKEEAVETAQGELAKINPGGTFARNAALFFPWVLESDPLREGQMDDFAPGGVVAGVMARTDRERGVWKAPAGIDAALNGIQGLQVSLTDAENGDLNPLGINCLRVFPGVGCVVWGARTLRGADQLADEYKYIPVRRLALYLEESLYRGLKWVVFEPNDEPLWSQIRLNVGAFMHNLFRQGAFAGKTPREAYFVKCDSETTTQTDVNLGIVNILVGFAPLKPAEFVIVKIQQMAGQIQV